MVTKRQADEAYEKGEPILTDEEYDETFGKNATSEFIDSNSPWKKMAHPDRFGGASLDKISVFSNGDLDHIDLDHWIRKFNSSYCCSYKYDGISVNLIYEKGQLIHSITKGAGNLGEDIRRNVLKMKNVLSHISKIDNMNACLKAEIIIDQETFERNLKGIYVNARNGAAGAARAFDGKNASFCTLKYYDIVFLDEDFDSKFSETQKFAMLESFGLQDIFWRNVKDSADILHFYNETMQRRVTLGYEIDGIVISVNDCTQKAMITMSSDERPRYMVAVKLPYSEKKSKILEITWQVGAKGRITPVAIIDPIVLGGAIVSRVTLKNLDEIKRLQVAPGDEVLVSRRGDVIPNIESNLTKHDCVLLSVHPVLCPVCKHKTSVESPYLFCRNSECQAKGLNIIKTWVAVIKDHFNYRGFADKRIEQLYESNLVKVPSDLYKLRRSQLLSFPGIGDAVTDDILAFQHFIEIPFSIFLTGLNIEGINYKMAKLVSEKFENFEDLEESYSCATLYSQLQSIPGFGDFRTLALIEGMDSRYEIWEELLEHVKVVPDEKAGSDKFNGLTFCITGTLSQPRDYFVKLVEDNGGKFVSGVTSKTNYLIAGGKVGAGKSKAAQEHNTKIITERELMDMLS